MPTQYYRSNNLLFISKEFEEDKVNSLPVGNWMVKHGPMTGYYLEKSDSFAIDFKLYGNTIPVTNRVINTFRTRPGSLGCLFSGEKGSGKSLLARNISVEAAKIGMPTLIVAQAFSGVEFMQFITSIDTECVILFDEYEKVYNHQEQEKMLSLLDGVFPQKKLFILTCNDKYRVDANIRNRPSRAYYMIEYRGLEQDFIEEYCQDNLNDKSKIGSVCKVASVFSDFNFDMLKAVVEDMNRYNETAAQVLGYLNAKPDNSSASRFTVKFNYDGKEDTDKLFTACNNYFNPLAGTLEISWEENDNSVCKESDTSEYHDKVLTSSDIVSLNAVNGSFVYETIILGKKLVVTAMREARRSLGMDSLLT